MVTKYLCFNIGRFVLKIKLKLKLIIYRK